MRKTREIWLIIALLFTAVLVCYGGVLSSGFVWDDVALVRENPLVRAPLYDLAMFRDDIIGSKFSYTIYYRPIQVLSYAIDYRFWSMAAAGYHFTNMFVHFLNSVLFFTVLGALYKKDNVVPFGGALLFAVSPMHAGAVAYISGRADLLAFFFGFSAVLCVVCFREKFKRLPFFSPAFILLALLSKESAAVFPVLALIAWFWAGRDAQGPGRSVRTIAHLANFSVLALYIAAHHFFFSKTYKILFGPGDIVPALTAYAKMVLVFFWKGLFPVSLLMREGFGGAGIPLAVVTMIAAGAAVLIRPGERRSLLFALFFYSAALFPLVFVVGYFNVLAGHWMYIAAFGLFSFAGMLFGAGISSGNNGRIVTGLSFAAMAALVGLYSFVTAGSAGAWKTDIDLSDKVMESSAGDKVALHYKAAALVASGKEKEAVAVAAEHTKLFPEDPRAWFIRGRISLASGRPAEAKDAFSRAIGLDPSDDDGYLGLGMTALYGNDVDAALKFFEKAVSINPKNSEAFLFLCQVYSSQKNDAKALEAALKARRLSPYGYSEGINLGTVYSRLGMARESAAEYLDLIRLYPERSMAYYNLAEIFYSAGDRERALFYVEGALRSDPGMKAAIDLYNALKK